MTRPAISTRLRTCASYLGAVAPVVGAALFILVVGGLWR